MTAYRFPVATVTCPEGTQMTGGGGGCKAMTPQGYVLLRESNPISDRAWRVQCDTPIVQDVMAQAYAICE